ncbi:hypothetical protein E4656_14720 [Natronospirillum operosum]|uniref:FecR protein domain-containing protein n=1 Tax=Natronospirillum operosum TaxID=2759953 RepID=A0A4Z0W4G4_9GAMM|nr:hypothetical protein [Natronospirillum operosum]TGG91651.1 hypothetical protein E4656_14720 [Natronospirillum operosum]
MDNRRQFLQRSLQLSLWSILAGAGTTALLGSRAQAQLLGRVPDGLPPGQSVYELQGEVMVDGQRADMTTLITPDSLIRTGSNSYIIFVVGRDAYILRENSELQLESEGLLATGLRLLTGKVLSVFGEREPEARLQMNTGIATIGIRGTGLYAEAHDDRSYVCTCYGLTELAAAAHPEQTERVAARYHESRYVLREPENGQLIVQAPFINHTDEELALIESLVGRQPPFNLMRQDYQGPRRRY